MDLDASAVSQHWPLTGVSLQPLASTYPTRHVLRVQSDQGLFAAKIDRSPAMSDGEGGLSVLTYLEERRFGHAPALLRTRTGELSVRFGAARVCLLEYLPAPVSDGTPEGDREGWRQLGAVAASLNGLPDCPIASQLRIDSLVQDLRAWAVEQRLERGFQELIPRFERLRGEPSGGLLHGEINFANAGRRADGTVVLLDWDGTGTGPTILEIGYPLIVVFLSEETHQFQVANAAAFYGAHARAIPSPTPDPRLLFSAALLQACFYVRFGDINRRWERIRYALDHEDEILSALEST